MTDWAQKIRDARAAGATLAQIGEAVGLSPGAVSDIEQGRTAEPRGMAAVKLHDLHPDVFGPAPTNDEPTTEPEAAHG